MLLTTEEREVLINNYVQSFKDNDGFIKEEDFVELILFRVINEMEHIHAERIINIKNMLDN